MKLPLLVSVLPLSSVSVLLFAETKLPVPLRLIAPTPPSTTFTPLAGLTMRLPTFSGPALFRVPPLSVRLLSVSGALLSRLIVPLLLMLLSAVSLCVLLLRLMVALLTILLSPLLPVLLLKLTLPPLTVSAPRLLPAALLNVVCAVPLLLRAAALTAVASVLTALPEKLSVPLPLSVPPRVLRPPPKFSTLALAV